MSESPGRPSSAEKKKGASKKKGGKVVQVEAEASAGADDASAVQRLQQQVNELTRALRESDSEREAHERENVKLKQELEAALEKHAELHRSNARILLRVRLAR